MLFLNSLLNTTWLSWPRERVASLSFEFGLDSLIVVTDRTKHESGFVAVKSRSQ